MATYNEIPASSGRRRQNERNVTFSIENEEPSDSIGTSASSSSTRVGTLREGTQATESGINSTCILFSVKILFGLIFFMIVLVSSVLSKISLVSLTDSLRHYTWEVQKKDGKDMKEEDKAVVVALYWQLLLILIVPNCLTFLRCFCFGFLGKTRKSFPWPTGKAMTLGLVSSLIEVVTMTILVFLVLTELSPGIAILSLNGIFLAQIALDASIAFKKRNCGGTENCNDIRRRSIRTGYRNVDNDNPEQQSLVEDRDSSGGGMKFLQRVQCVLEHYTVKGVAFLLQGAGIIGLAIYWGMKMHLGEATQSVYLRPVIGLPFVLLVLSVIWCNRFQEAIAKSYVRRSDKIVSARYKSSLINSGLRIILYPVVTYLIFRYLTPFHQEVDPWCLHGPCFHNFSGKTLNVMIVHIVTSFVSYFIVWVSCTMTLSQLSVGLPLLLSTPVAVAFCYIDTFHHFKDHFFPLFYQDEGIFEPFIYSSIVASFLWVSQVLAMGFYICTKTNIILATDQDMFLAPHYDSVFLEQYTILNRQVNKGVDKEDNTIVKRRNPRMIFICSTMYRETDTEMKQMLASILRVSRHYEKEHSKDPNCCDKYESHIFFDGAINANQIEDFGLQLLSLLEETLDIKLQRAIKKKTPYGYRFSWDLGVRVRMPFNVHFKDKTLVKAKKRWSQVMYMNYVINHRIVEEKLSPHDTFILTTDADIDFTANSVVVLLDMLAPNLNVAAVCARTHPKGYGLVYWYQVFDYAIGHWFQKPAEHILGSVLCSPGCFSVFRCSALKLVLETYSTEVNGASEFLMKDMGEDRWLCTLLVKEGLRLEYCAISEDQTYCPTEFNEFYKQRRRWIPSTVANLVMLVSESGIITRGNDSISIIYILFQVIMIFSTAISPATIILIISAGLNTFHVPLAFTTTVLSLTSVVYGLICLYASPKTQLDVAKLLTFVFALIMSVVMIGIVKDAINSLLPDPNKLLIGPGNCDNFIVGGNKTKEYFDCMKGHDYAANYTNGLYSVFQVPVPITVVYTAALFATFLLAGILHLPELHCLLHFVWYMLGLPSGYLLLLIYSAANLCDRSWGTREQNTGEDEGLWGWRVYLIQAKNTLTSLWCCVKCGLGSDRIGAKQEVEGGGVTVGVELEGGEDGKSVAMRSESAADGNEEETVLTNSADRVIHVDMDEDAEEWLIQQECEEYVEIFKNQGYTSKRFIASMSDKDFEAIGITKRGFRLRLEKAAKALSSLRYESGNHYNVREWLQSLELEQYSELFHQEGYKWNKDIPNMRGLKESQLKAMGITKRAHLQRVMKALGYLSRPPVEYSEMDGETRKWLSDNECQEYMENFVKNGYTKKHFIAGIKEKDLKAIGVDRKGFRLRLEKAAQQLAPLTIRVDIPNSVAEWLAQLELSEYSDLFHNEGYKNAEDIVNLKELDQTQLKAIGVTKMAHLQRFRLALDSLAIPSIAEQNKRRTKIIIDNIGCTSLENVDDTESDFWRDLISRKLKPVSQKFTQNRDVHKALESLRNLTLALLLLVNLMWIVLLGSLTFWQLEKYNIDPRAFQLLFLAVYGLIMIVQFFTMLAHRAVTLVHYLGRVKLRVNPWGNYDKSAMLVSVQDLRR